MMQSVTPPHDRYNYTKGVRRSRNAFVMTDTELKLIAAAAIMGFNSRLKNGKSAPAAIGTPSML